MEYDPVRDEILVNAHYLMGVLTFRGDADGNVAPVRNIFGPKTQIGMINALALDPVHGEIFVPQNDRVLVFDRDADGDVAPIRILEGPPELPSNWARRLAVDPVNNLLIATNALNRGEGRAIRIFERTASGNARPLRVITGPGAADVWLMRVNPANGMIFGVVRPGSTGGQAGTVEELQGRYDLEDYVGVWSVFDDGDVPPRWTIGGPNLILKDARGIALDPERQDVYVSDKTINALFRFHVPEAFR